MKPELPSLNQFADNSGVPPIEATGEAESPLSGREAYNIVSDTVAGVNTRKSDNVFQLKVIVVCLIMGGLFGVIGGASLSDPGERLISALAAGLFVGFLAVVLGLLGSGIYLMVYRAMCHFKGKHD